MLIKLILLVLAVMGGGGRCGVLYHRQHAGSITVKGLRAVKPDAKPSSAPSASPTPDTFFPPTPFASGHAFLHNRGSFSDVPLINDYPVRLIKITRTIAVPVPVPVPVLAHPDSSSAYLQLRRPPFARGHFENVTPSSSSSSHGPPQSYFDSYEKNSLYDKDKNYT